MTDAVLVEVPVGPEVESDVAEAARIKQSFYRHLIGAARFFSEGARQFENGVARKAPVTDDSVRHRSYVTGAILSAAGFLEASINELYLELHARSEKRTRLPKRVLAVLGRFWSDIERAPVLHRYQTVLMVADAERFDERRAPFQDADSLMKLRDALVHFRPERPESRRRQRTLEQRLQNRFEPNPIAPADSPWFPDRCLSAGCAEWAVQAADEFSNAFCTRMSLPARGLAWCDVNSRQARPPSARPIELARSAALNDDLVPALNDDLVPNEVPPPGDGR